MAEFHWGKDPVRYITPQRSMYSDDGFLEDQNRELKRMLKDAVHDLCEKCGDNECSGCRWAETRRL